MANVYDKHAVVALLRRYVEAWMRRDEDQKLASTITARLAGYAEQFQQLQIALLVFGFDTQQSEVWKNVRSLIGDAAYDEAISDAQKALSDNPQALIHKSEPAPEKLEKLRQDEEAISTQLLPSQARRSNPTVRDAILSRLESVGEKGAKASDLRAFLQTNFGMKLHEKTAGMSLYRLSQEDPPKVRRDGRTWFFVPHSSGTKNPGGETPGSVENLL